MSRPRRTSLFSQCFDKLFFYQLTNFSRSWDGILRGGTGFVLTQSLATAAAAVSMSCTFELHMKSHDRRILGRTSVPISPASQEHLLHDGEKAFFNLHCTILCTVHHCTHGKALKRLQSSNDGRKGRGSPRLSPQVAYRYHYGSKDTFLFFQNSVTNQFIFFARISPRRASASRTCSPSTRTPPRWRR